MIAKQVVRNVHVGEDSTESSEKIVQAVVDEMAEKGFFLASLSPLIISGDGRHYEYVWLVFKEPNRKPDGSFS